MILYRNVFYIIGIVLLVFSGVMLLPGFVDLVAKNEVYNCFIIGFMLCSFLGGLLFLSTKDNCTISLNIREKTIFILFIWFLLPCLGSLPLILSPYQISYINALFETTSAITTSGTTICDINNFSDGFLLWEGILQFFGGILFVFTCIYIFPALKQTDRYICDSSQNYSLCKVTKLVGIFAGIKIMFVLLASFFLAGSGISAINSLCSSLAMISGSGMIPNDIEYSYNGVNWIFSILMLMSGISVGFINNFLVNGVYELKNRQFMFYIGVIITFSIILSIHFFYTSNIGIVKSIEKSIFATISSVTTTGLQSNTDEWVNNILYVLNFCGGCSGSCTGGIKIFRIMTILLILKTYFIKLVKTNAVYVPSFDGRRISEFDITNLFSYFICFIVLAILFSVILSFSDMEFGKAFGGVVTAMNNNGPFLGSSKATALQLLMLSTSGKLVLIAAMISGRLEFVLFFMFISRIFWKR